MKIFGDKNNFAIEYSFLSNSNYSTYGYISLWINDNNICIYNQNYQYEGDLYIIVEWFCEKLEFILGYDMFPLPVKGCTALELVNNANQYDSENMLEFDLWHTAKNRWILNHCWFIARGGSVLPCVYFQRIEEGIEISWDNSFWKKDDIVFESLNGVQTVRFETFSGILSEFLFSAISDFGKIVNNKEEIDSLKRKINLLEI